MMKIIRFKHMGGLSRKPYLVLSNDRFWIEPGTIALQVGEIARRPAVEQTSKFRIDSDYKDVVPLIMNDGTTAFAVCAPGGWDLWIEEL